MEIDRDKIQDSEFSRGHVLTPGIKDRITGRASSIVRSIRVWIDGEYRGRLYPPQDLEKSGVPRRPLPSSGESSVSLPIPKPPEVNTRVKDSR